jgi:outer membrane protein OmpA-like peptidoglycan-associated protein
VIRAGRVALVLLPALLAACAPRQALFVVLPGANGEVGAVTVNDGKTSRTLDKAYAAEELRGGTGEPAAVEPKTIGEIFALAFSARPILPTHYRFFYDLGSDRLGPESLRGYIALYHDVARRPVYQVRIVGYADAYGDGADSWNLSRLRAERVHDLLLSDGFNPRAVVFTGRGDLDPLVPSPPATPEPKNRRVEITVQ